MNGKSGYSRETTSFETMTANIDTLQVTAKEEQVALKKAIQDITTVTFCGCGFLGGYLVGVATYLQEHAAVLLKGRIAGSSVGSLVATCIVCDVPLQKLRECILSAAKTSGKYFLGPLNPFFPNEKTLLKNLLSELPEDAHIRASGRLFLSLTRVSSLSNEIVSEYNTRDELIDAVICSCFLPGISGITVPTFQGRRYIDGVMSNSIPFRGPETLSINAFVGNFDIKPLEDEDFLAKFLPKFFGISMTRTNMRKLFQASIPPSPEFLDKYYYLGYADGQKHIPVVGGGRRKSFLENFFG